MITAQELREVLDYDPETGVFRWRVRPSIGAMLGSEAGRIHLSGYRKIKIKGKEYLAHRFAWAMVHGSFPDGQIDHINGIRDDNRIDNLRIATHDENCRNRKAKPDSVARLKGVSLQAGRWRSQITVNKRQLHLGYFNCPTAAHLAYCKAAKAHFGEFAREK